MGRWLLLGMLTGAIFSVALFLSPVPMGPLGQGSLAVLSPGTYRMAGTIVRNSCGVTFAPWPDEWEITENSLVVGTRRFVARPMRSAVVYQVEREEPDACIAASWMIKLAPRGVGVVGDAVWEVRPLDKLSLRCELQPAPCAVVATVEGLPLGR